MSYCTFRGRLRVFVTAAHPQKYTNMSQHVGFVFIPIPNCASTLVSSMLKLLHAVIATDEAFLNAVLLAAENWWVTCDPAGSLSSVKVRLVGISLATDMAFP